MNTSIDSSPRCVSNDGIRMICKQPKVLQEVQQTINAHPNASLTSISKDFAKRYELYNRAGKLQYVSAFKAFREEVKKENLHGNFDLDFSETQKDRQAILLSEDVLGNYSTETLKEYTQGVELVETSEQMHIWNTVMNKCNPELTKSMVGNQVHFLFTLTKKDDPFDVIYVGGCAFSSANLNMAARDDMIGWSRSERSKGVNRIIKMSRFGMRSEVTQETSILFGQSYLDSVMSQLKEVYKREVGENLVLVETYVTEGTYLDTCLAYFWREAGKTSDGRTVYTNLLVDDALEQLTKNSLKSLSVLAVEDVRDSSITKMIVEKNILNDLRNSKRLAKVLKDMYDVADSKYKSAVNGKEADIKAFYHLINNKSVEFNQIIEFSKRSALRLAQNYETVYCIDDWTDLNFTWKVECHKIMGSIGKNATTVSKGLRLHTLLLVNEYGMVLGVLAADLMKIKMNSEKTEEEKREEFKQTKIWIKHYDVVCDVKRMFPSINFVYVADREADFYELLLHIKNNNHVNFVIRANIDRYLSRSCCKLFDKLKKSKNGGKIKIEIERSGTDKYRRRTADVNVRWGSYTVRKSNNSFCVEDHIPLNAISLHEVNANKNVKKINWILLTSLPISKVEDAEKCMNTYSTRWRIEDWHKTLKTVCEVEKIGNVLEQSIRNHIAIKMIFACRTLFLTYLGRTNPEKSVTLIFTEEENIQLKIIAEELGLVPPENLGEAMNLIAMLGGYRNRKGEEPPGMVIMTNGYRKFSLRVAASMRRLQYKAEAS